MTQALIFVVFPFCLAVAAFSDLFTMTIPNRVSAILLAAFFLAAPLAGLGLADIGPGLEIEHLDDRPGRRPRRPRPQDRRHGKPGGADPQQPAPGQEKPRGIIGHCALPSWYRYLATAATSPANQHPE